MAEKRGYLTQPLFKTNATLVPSRTIGFIPPSLLNVLRNAPIISFLYKMTHRL